MRPFHTSFQKRMVLPELASAFAIPLNVVRSFKMLRHQNESFMPCPGTFPFE
jgi:hypothetical protein